jgi:hypothetical protein
LHVTLSSQADGLTGFPRGAADRTLVAVVKYNW